MKLTYSKGNEIIDTNTSNKDVEILIEKTDSSIGQRTKVQIKPKETITLLNAVIEKEMSFKKSTAFLLNGYQSWTDTKEFFVNDYMRGLNHLPKKLKEKYQFEQYGDYHFTTYDKNLFHGFTYAYIRNEQDYEFVGSLNEKNAYLIIYYDLEEKQIRLISDIENREVNDSFTVFDYLEVKGSHDEVFNHYMSLLPKARKLPTLLGYTSWYNHYQNIHEEMLLKDLDALSKDYDLFQIDDGYQTYIGDWHDIDKNKFPNGLNLIKNKIESKEMIPGIWLAPFVCEKDSTLFKEHPEYIAKDENGDYVMGGSNWSGFYALDWQKPFVKEYIENVLKTFKDQYGFKFFKLDFLYAASLTVCKNKTRAELMHEAMEFIRSCLGDATILGCGMPLSSGFGIVDYCRIGPDVSLKFDDVWYMKWMHRERISTKNTILNTIFRREISGHVFYNDPDVYLLRDENMHLSDKQKEALIVINFLFGNLLLTSDNISILSHESKKLYEKAKKLLKATDKKVVSKKHRIHIHYILDNQEYMIIYNSKKGIIEKWKINE